MKKALYLAIIGTLTGVAVAFAQSHGHPGLDQRFEQLDANHDGKVDKTELSAGMRQLFDGADKNKDGKVSKDEFEAQREIMRGKHPEHMQRSGPAKGHEHGNGFFAHLDQNGDGTIEASELQQAAAKRFERLDANHDGSVDKTELAAHHRFGRHECDQGGKPGSAAGAAGGHG